MKRSEVIKNHKKSKIKKQTFSLFQSIDAEDLHFEKIFNVYTLKDINGWISQIKLLDRNSRGITVTNYDGDIEIKLNYNEENKKISLPLYVFADIVAAGQILNKIGKSRLWGKNKIKRKKEVSND